MSERDENEQRGFRPIGSLLPQSGILPPGSDSTPMPSRPSFATTGARSPAQRGSSSTGRQLSEIAVGNSLAVAQRAAVERGNPADLDRAIVASLPPSVGSILTPTYRDRIDPVYGFDTEFEGYRLAGKPSAGDLMLARQMVGQCLRGADEGLIKRELARLRASTKARAESDDDLAMGFQVLAEECAGYPPDVVVWALRGWARMETFYPSLAEIRDRLQRGARKRRAMMEAVDCGAASAA